MRKFRVVVNGKEYVVEVEEIGYSANADGENIRTEQVSTNKIEGSVSHPAKSSDGEVLAPMPGKIVSLMVNKGDSVKEGQVVAILEAMKMENEIQAPKGGVVVDVRVSKGANVNRGDVLLVIE